MTSHRDTVTINVPFRIVKRGGRREMHLPSDAPAQSKADATLIKAMARAFRWKRMLESGRFSTMSELARSEGIAPSYIARVLRLTLLAPDLVEAILDGRTVTPLAEELLRRGVDADWNIQWRKLAAVSPVAEATLASFAPSV